MVEHIAHDGFVVGSNPTKPKNMELTPKKHKKTKIKSILKKTKILFLFHSIYENNKRWIKSEQNLFKNNLNFHWLDTSILSLILKNSVFFNLTNLISGSIILLYFKNFSSKKFLIKDFFKISAKLRMTCVIIKKRAYHLKSILNLTTLKFINNINSLASFLKHFLYILFLSSFLLLNKKITSK